MVAKNRVRSKSRGKLTTGLMTLMLVLPALYSGNDAWAQLSQSASDQIVNFSIKPQSLAKALTEFGLQSGMQVSISANLARGRNSAGAWGELGPQEALQRILSGTGIQAEFIGNNTALLSPASTAVSTNDGFLLDPIVVNAELQPRDLQNSPTSVVVETGEQLEQRGDGDIYKVVERTPNVTSIYGQKGFSIRGIDQNGSGGSFNDLLISTQIDGVALPSAQSTFFAPYSTWDVDQVEILRGPQSTQQGRNALAGAVVIRSKDPTYDREIKLRAGIGTRHHYQGALMANLPVVDEKLAVRFSVERTQEDGWVKNPTLGQDDYDAKENTNYRAKLRWDPTEDINLILSYSDTKSYGGEDYVDLNSFPSHRYNFSNLSAREGSHHKNLGLRTGWIINDYLSLDTETNYYKHDYKRFEDIDNTALPQGEFSATGKSEVFEQDVRLKIDTDRIEGTFGVFYSEIKDSRPFTAVADLGRFVPALAGTFDRGTNDTSFDVTNAAIYGEADIDVSALLDGLKLTLGMRYDWEHFSFATQSDYLLNQLGADVPYTTGSSTYDAFLPKLGVTYALAEEQSISLTYQRGYRSGGSMVNVGSGKVYDYEPEYTDNFELAYRGTFFDERFKVRANAFYTHWTDQQVQVKEGLTGPLARYDFYTVNAGESELFGAEFTAEADLTDRFSIFSSLGLVKTRYLDFQDKGTSYDGNSFISVPDVTFALGGEYRWDNGVTLGVDASYTSASYTDNANTTKVDERFLVNSHLNYEHESGLTLGLYGRNLFDEDYITQKLPGSSLVRVGEPRTFGAHLTKSF